MSESARLDFTITVPAAAPAVIKKEESSFLLPSDLDKGSWLNGMKRWFIPNFASTQDKNISALFIDYFKKSFNAESFNQKDVKSVLSLANKHIASSRHWPLFSKTPTHLARLEHYLFAAQDRFQLFDAASSRQSLKEKCRLDNPSLLARWTRLGFAEDTFWSSPDLVDFTFKTHLHRHITHPQYNHTVTLQPTIVRRCGQITIIHEPHLLVNGRQTPWFELRNKMQIDEDQRLYSTENGKKKFWVYLENGFTHCDRHDFAEPHRLRKLQTPPLQSRVEIVTSHAHKNEWDPTDRILKGTRHAFFRIITGQGFAARHPELGLVDGAVYSFGWGPRWRDFSFFSPLATLRGRWFCPDNFEFFKNDLCVTPKEVTDEQLIHLFNNVKKKSREDHPFHMITANCSGRAAEVLNDAKITDLKTKTHFTEMAYQFLFPKIIRRAIKILPSGLRQVAYRSGTLLFRALTPMLSLFGAWRKNITFDEVGGVMADEARKSAADNQIKPLFSHVSEMFQSNKMQFDLTKNIYKWQKKQPGTYFEYRK